MSIMSKMDKLQNIHLMNTTQQWKNNKVVLHSHNVEQARHERVYTVRVHLHKVWAQTKLICFDRDWYLMGGREGWE